MSPLLYKIPEVLVAGYQSGQFSLVGAMMKDVTTGQIVGHVQQTGVFGHLMSAGFTGMQNSLTGGFNPLGIVSVIQNHQIKGQLTNVQGSLALMQNLQIGTLAVSGVGLGVAAIGFAVMIKRLNAISGHLNTLESKIDLITRERRSDELRAIFTDISSTLNTVDTLQTRKSPQAAGERAQEALAGHAGRLEEVFKDHSNLSKAQSLADGDLDLLWSLAAAIRVCHEAGIRALFTIDELATAQALAKSQAERLLQLSQTLSPDALARLAAHTATDPIEAAERRKAILPKAQTLVSGLRATVASVASQSALSGSLLAKNTSGRAYLDAVEAEEEEPLLFLPA